MDAFFLPSSVRGPVDFRAVLPVGPGPFGLGQAHLHGASPASWSSSRAAAPPLSGYDRGARRDRTHKGVGGARKRVRDWGEDPAGRDYPGASGLSGMPDGLASTVGLVRRWRAKPVPRRPGRGAAGRVVCRGQGSQAATRGTHAESRGRGEDLPGGLSVPLPSASPRLRVRILSHDNPSAAPANRRCVEPEESLTLHSSSHRRSPCRAGRRERHRHPDRRVGIST